MRLLPLRQYLIAACLYFFKHDKMMRNNKQKKYKIFFLNAQYNLTSFYWARNRTQNELYGIRKRDDSWNFKQIKSKYFSNYILLICYFNYFIIFQCEISYNKI